jgi:hypothetical protein
VEAHHLFSRKAGCPDDLTVWLCFGCHGRAHEMKRRTNIVHLTTAALAAKKAQGAKLGNRTNLAEARAKGQDTIQKGADAFAANVLPIVREIQASGATSYAAIAEALNARGVRTARGGTWHASSARNVVIREGVSVI